MGNLLKKVMPLMTNGPCPCGQGRKLQVCCLTANGKVRRRVGRLTPHGTITGYAHPKCYLKETINCCQTLSAEHYISKAVLSEIGKIFFMPFPWLEEGEVARVGINAMKANILCKRHNSALSELDTHARDFFRFVRRSVEHVSNNTLSKKSPVFLVSGDAIELWAIKMLIGLYHAKVASHNREILKSKFSLDIEWFCSALANPGMSAPTGLYVVKKNSKLNGELSVAPLSVNDDKRVIGIQFSIGPVTMDCILDQRGVNFPYLEENYFYRPSAININSMNKGTTIFMSWLDGVERESVNLEIASL